MSKRRDDAVAEMQRQKQRQEGAPNGELVGHMRGDVKDVVESQERP